MCSKKRTNGSTGACWDELERLRTALDEAEAVVIGAGAGLSTSAGFVYDGERFQRYFADFAAAYHFAEMYAGGFYPYDSPEQFWAYWSRYIWVNRYMDPPKPVYDTLLELVRGKDFFVLTTNVDHCFQKAGFEKDRLFYTQGDYGLFQCSRPCHRKTYDNEAQVRSMVEAQGWTIEADNSLTPPADGGLTMHVPAELIPRCPVCGEPMTMNLRSDDHFVEDAGWHQAARRYQRFMEEHRGKVLFLEMGVGYNTPGIIKYPFWKRTMQLPGAIYACVNDGQAVCPEEIRVRAVCLDGDIGAVLMALRHRN